MKIGLYRVHLHKIERRREQNHANNNKNHEQHELISGRLERVRQYLQAFEMLRQLKDPKHAHQPNNAQNREFRRGVGDLHKIRQDREQVDDVAHLLHERFLVRRRVEPHDELNAEPNRANRFDQEKLVLNRHRRYDGRGRDERRGLRSR